MANIKKNFNFRNGVQVDDDNLLVTSTGLVGIGTTIPIEALDVRGNVIITGFTSATSQNVGFLTVATLEPTKIIGAGLSVVSGIVTAQGTGIITFFGDASNLLGMPTSQWADVDVGLGFTSIYNTGGNVGITTLDPRTTLQVGGNVDAGEKGIGISSVGNINAAGIVTATTFVGNLTGDVSGRISGDTVGNVNSSGLSTFTNLSVTGVTTFAGITTFSNNYVTFNPPIGSQVDFFGALPDQRMRFRNNGSNSQLQFYNNLHLIFGTDSRTQFDPHGSGSAGHFRIEQYMDNGDNPFQIHSDFTNIMGSPTGGHEGRKIADFNYSDGTKLYHFGAQKLQTSGVGVTITSQLDVTNVNVSGVATISEIRSDELELKNAAGTETFATFSNNGSSVLKFDNLNRVETTSLGVNITGELETGYIGASSTVFGSKMGVGTTEAPVNEIQVRKSGNAEIRVSSESGIAAVSVGRETGTTNTNNAAIRYGGGSGYPYSSATSLDVLNYGTGNFNYYISANNPSGIQGDFHWHRGANASRLMTLTGIGGSLGIGITQPSTNLDVEGGGQFSGNVTVGNNLIVGGALLGNVQGTLNGNVAGFLEGNTNTTVGISTLNNLSIAGIVTASQANITSIGIGTNPEINRPLRINDTVDERIFVTSTGSIGIRTSEVLTGVAINALTSNMSLGGIGIGVTTFTAAVDLQNAGLAVNRFVILPKMNNSGRNSLQNVVSGAVIYNTETNTIQVFTGSVWRQVQTQAV